MFKRTTLKGELKELQLRLINLDLEIKKESIKQVIAYMTVGKDVSGLFTDVLNCLETKDLEIKKLVYLYLMKYASKKSEQAILVVNTLVQDTKDKNPLIRALAIRTMGSIRVEEVTEYLCQPLRKCLKDKHPYVRKTAAICIAKLFILNPELVQTQGFLSDLKKMISDSNPMVVSNALVALQQINESSTQPIFVVDHKNIMTILNALNESTEWGQIQILESAAQCAPKNENQACIIIEKVIPHLSHSNSSVVLTAVRVVLNMLNTITKNQGLIKKTSEQLSSSLVTLLSGKPEIQYIALRNVNLIVQRFPKMLRSEIKMFFCKYNDPIYVKMEKLDVMVMLASKSNIELLLREFQLYAKEVDVQFVRKSIRAIGKCAIKIPKVAEKCAKALLDLIMTNVSYVVQEVVIVVKDIFRKFPNQYESLITRLCEHLDSLDDPEAKSSMIWIIGEYCDRIENADELIDDLTDSFTEEPHEVQLQLLTATVKLFLKKPSEASELIQKVITIATEQIDNSDLRDRAYFYWRLLSENPTKAKSIVLDQRPLISSENYKYDEIMLSELVRNIPKLSSIYHKPSEMFVQTVKVFEGGENKSEPSSEENEKSEESEDSGEIEQKSKKTKSKKSKTKVKSKPKTKTKTKPKTKSKSKTKEKPENKQETILMTNINGGQTTNNNNNNTIETLIDLGFGMTNTQTQTKTTNTNQQMNNGQNLMGMNINTTVDNNNNNNSNSQSDFFSSLNNEETTFSIEIEPKKLLLNSTKGKGIQIEGTFRRRNREIFFDLSITNKTSAPVGGLAIAFNTNLFGLKPKAPVMKGVLMPTQTRESSIKCPIDKTHIPKNAKANLNIQIALRCSGKNLFFHDRPPLNIFLKEDLKILKRDFLNHWKQIPEETEMEKEIDNVQKMDISYIKHLFENKNIFFVTKRKDGDLDILYFATKFESDHISLLELVLISNMNKIQLNIRSVNPTYNILIFQFLENLLKK
ncbi:ap-1 complex subunit beta-1 [Anaeramoeba flamelloides]|uniref:AP complex subunit beta n=1 Tax=Anaeramoeba flamelloides TaxID=1746091 RepID=A0ABQ8YYB8_9EUKA|nr:ap-1 complex subunit beta-1 [Anaeramoeba flamelloides]